MCCYCGPPERASEVADSLHAPGSNRSQARPGACLALDTRAPFELTGIVVGLLHRSAAPRCGPSARLDFRWIVAQFASLREPRSALEASTMAFILWRPVKGGADQYVTG